MNTKERVFGTKHPDKYQVLYRLALYVSAVIMGFVGVFPLYWMAINAFKSRQAILEGGLPGSLIVTPETFTLARFEAIFDPTMLQYIINSIIVTTTAILGALVFSLISGYGLARFRFRGKNTFARVLLFGYMFSPIVLVLPMYLIFDALGLLNSRVAMGLALSALAMPFAVWLMWKYISTIPPAMEESAWIAGAERWETFLRIIVPQTKPALIANALFAFSIAWNDFTFAQVLLPSQESRTFAPGLLRMIADSASTGFGEFMAIGLVLTLPAFLFAYFLQSYLLRGFEIRAL
jgi:multiple sugar transport system permease protein